MVAARHGWPAPESCRAGLRRQPMLAPHLIRQLAGVAEHDGRHLVLHGLQLLQHRQHEHCAPGTRRQPQPARNPAARPPPLAGRATARLRHSRRPPGTHRPSCPCPTWPGTARPCPGLPEGCTRAALRPAAHSSASALGLRLAGEARSAHGATAGRARLPRGAQSRSRQSHAAAPASAESPARAGRSGRCSSVLHKRGSAGCRPAITGAARLEAR